MEIDKVFRELCERRLNGYVEREGCIYIPNMGFDYGTVRLRHEGREIDIGIASDGLEPTYPLRGPSMLDCIFNEMKKQFNVECQLVSTTIEGNGNGIDFGNGE